MFSLFAGIHLGSSVANLGNQTSMQRLVELINNRVGLGFEFGIERIVECLGYTDMI